MDKEKGISNRLKTINEWQVSTLAVVSADIYGLYIVMMQYPDLPTGRPNFKGTPVINFVAGSPNGRHVVMLFIGNHYEIVLPDGEVLYSEWRMKKLENTDPIRLKAYMDVDRKILNKRALPPLLPLPCVEFPEKHWL